MLEALYEKTCLPKCSGNSLNLHFEYLNVSVAQKLTELRFFLAQQLLFMLRSPKINVRCLVWKNLFSKLFSKLIEHEFWVLKRFCSSKTEWVTFVLAQTLSEPYILTCLKNKLSSAESYPEIWPRAAQFSLDELVSFSEDTMGELLGKLMGFSGDNLGELYGHFGGTVGQLRVYLLITGRESYFSYPNYMIQLKFINVRSYLLKTFLKYFKKFNLMWIWILNPSVAQNFTELHFFKFAFSKVLVRLYYYLC